jgi:hypothetical protein
MARFAYPACQDWKKYGRVMEDIRPFPGQSVIIIINILSQILLFASICTEGDEEAFQQHELNDVPLRVPVRYVLGKSLQLQMASGEDGDKHSVSHSLFL